MTLARSRCEKTNVNPRLSAALKLFVATIVAGLGASTAAGCTAGADPVPSTVAGGCSTNSDCATPLVCAFGKCHDACATSSDCAPGERCMASDRPFHVCQLPSETHCARTSDCPAGQICAADLQCRDSCRADRDCVGGQQCIHGACAEPAEIDAGLGALADAGLDASVGVPCVVTSDCPAGLACRSGLCSFECIRDGDCAEGATCVDHVCHARACSPDGGPIGGDFCTLDSDCLSPLVCRASRCTCQCLTTSDCGDAGLACVDGRCLGPSDGGTDAGDAGRDAAVEGGIVMTGGAQLSPVGYVGKSAHYVLVFSVGEPIGKQISLSSPGYRLRGGVVGANGSVP